MITVRSCQETVSGAKNRCAGFPHRCAAGKTRCAGIPRRCFPGWGRSQGRKTGVRFVRTSVRDFRAGVRGKKTGVRKFRTGVFGCGAVRGVGKQVCALSAHLCGKSVLVFFGKKQVRASSEQVCGGKKQVFGSSAQVFSTGGRVLPQGVQSSAGRGRGSERPAGGAYGWLTGAALIAV